MNSDCFCFYHENQWCVFIVEIYQQFFLKDVSQYAERILNKISKPMQNENFLSGVQNIQNPPARVPSQFCPSSRNC